MTTSTPVPLRLVKHEPRQRLLDISPLVSSRTDVWPGDTKFSTRRVMDLDAGSSCTVTTITTTVQIGSHADAPLHFSAGGEDAASMDLRAFVGPARVARMPRREGITLADVRALDLRGVERLLLHARPERPRGPARFDEGFAWLEPDAAEHLAGAGLRLLGTDGFSVDHPESKTLDSHHALMRGGCYIIEGLDLTGVTPGDYELIALPLKLSGCDASPVRAILRDLPASSSLRGGLPRGARRRASPAGDIADRIPPSRDGEPMQLNCLHSSMHLKKGDKVKVTLDTAANVMLLADRDFDAYLEGKGHHYYGGWVTESPVELAVPEDGRWNLIIDSPGDTGRGVGAKVEVVR